MQIDGYKNSDKYILEIEGVIKNFDEIAEFKVALNEALEGSSGVEIHIQNSDIISSALIGLLIKTIFTSKTPIEVVIYSDKLLATMTRLNLIDALKIRRM